jgi:antitoxin (DNA-binding transcriptional repressor) of toxin-antitoxin stability system
MPLTASELRENIYKILDQILETGIPVEIDRRGKILRIVPAEPRSKLDRLPRREGVLNCDPEDIVHMDWYDEWKP